MLEAIYWEAVTKKIQRCMAKYLGVLLNFCKYVVFITVTQTAMILNIDCW